MGNLRTIKADIGLLNICMDFQDLLAQNGFFLWGEQNRGKGGAILTPNKVVFTFGGSYICAISSKNLSRNAAMSKPTDRHTDRLTDRHKLI